MTEIEGIIKAVSKDRKGVMIDEVWYNSFNPMEVNKGEFVIINFTKNDKGFNNVDSIEKVEINNKQFTLNENYTDSNNRDYEILEKATLIKTEYIKLGKDMSMSLIIKDIIDGLKANNIF